MGDRRRHQRAANFDEWVTRFFELVLEDDTYSEDLFRALEPASSSPVELVIVLELLFDHVNGNYWFGASDGDWRAFRGELDRIRRKALAFVSEIEQLGHLKIFRLSARQRGFHQILAAFVAREHNAFLWRQSLKLPMRIPFGVAAQELRHLSAYVQTFMEYGDNIWDYRNFAHQNLVLLSLFLKQTTEKWRDKEVATLCRLAFKAAGKRWRPEDNPTAAIAELRRRYRTGGGRVHSIFSLSASLVGRQKRGKGEQASQVRHGALSQRCFLAEQSRIQKDWSLHLA